MHHDLAVALEAAHLAGRYVRQEYEAFAPIPNAPASITTHVDRGAQELILKHLHAAFPTDGLCAEERTETLAAAPTGSDRMWVVDPIDGTRGFAMKNGEFSVMIGLTVGGVPVVGVVLEPVQERVTYAAAGGGCWARVGTGTPVPCVVKAEADPAAAVLVQSHTKPGRPNPVAAAVGPRAVREMYSAGVKLAVVARGEADVYVNTYAAFSDWDICAGHILVTEAGGRVTGLKGEPIRYGGPRFVQAVGLVAGSATIQDAVLARLERL